MTNKPEKSVGEIVEEFIGRFSELLDDAMIENVDVTQKLYFNMHFKPISLKYLGKQLTQTLQTERQKRDEMVEKERERINQILISFWREERIEGRTGRGSKSVTAVIQNNLLIKLQETLTQTNNK